MLSREFQVKEGQKVQLRLEAYNVTNTVRPGLGYTNAGAGSVLSSSTFGSATTNATPAGPTTAPARVLQLAVKYVF
jgi:hypothetical protein